MSTTKNDMRFWTFYGGSTLVFSSAFRLTQHLPLDQFFGIQACIFALWQQLLMAERKKAWGIITTPHGYPFGSEWKEGWPVWCYHTSLIKCMCYCVMFPILAFDIHANNITDLHQPFSAVSRLYTIPMAMQFGFMIGDFLPFFPEMKPNLLFAVHHIVTMVLAFCIVFWMPACFAFSAILAEFGSLCWMYYIMWGWRKTYLFGMPFANVAPLGIGIDYFIKEGNWPGLHIFFVVAGTGLALGRMEEWYRLMFPPVKDGKQE